MALGDTGRGQADYVDVLPLARGGMGAVSIAVRRRGDFSRLYAVKRLHPTLLSDPQLTASFIDEARIAGLIRDSHVVSVIDVGTDAQGPYLVMDWIESVPLHRVIRKARERVETIPLGFCVDVIRQIAEGLHAAHELHDHTGKALDVVHRDVSPQNILVGYDGVVRVTDFGIARALDRQSETQTGQIKGKLGYLSPEQVRCEPLDRRSDLFSLGIVAFELLTAQRLYAGGPVAILADGPPDLGEYRDDVPDELVELIIDLLSKKAEHRPATALEVVHRLQRMITELTQDEGVSVRAYMDDNFVEDRKQLRARLSVALEEAASGAQPGSRRKIGAAVTVASLALGATLFFAFSGDAPIQSDAPPDIERAAEAPPEAERAEPDPAEIVGEGAAEETAEVPTAPEPEPETEAQEGSRRRRRAARRRARSMAPMAPSPSMQGSSMQASTGMGVTPWPYQ